jgi:SAM-dependent methyltransferase
MKLCYRGCYSCKTPASLPRIELFFTCHAHARQYDGFLRFTNHTEVHTVVIGYGSGSFGAHLFSKKLLTVCIAMYELYGSQVQLALERGLPAMLASFISRRLPYPPLSFDMVHCARCDIDWEQKDGAFLIEADRVHKPGAHLEAMLGSVPTTKRNHCLEEDE